MADVNAPPQLREVLGTMGRDVVALQDSLDQRAEPSGWALKNIRLTVHAGASLVFTVGLGFSQPERHP